MICGSGKYFRVLSVGMAAGLLASCSSRPGEVLSDDVMAALLADLYVGEAYTVLEGPMAASASIGDIDSAQRVLRLGTMQKHGVTEAQFDTTLRWYGHHLDRYDDVCEKVIERIKEAGREARTAHTGASAGASLWQGPANLRMQAADRADMVSFDISGNVGKGGRIIWEYKTLNLTSPLDVFLAVDYADGSTGYVSRSQSSRGMQNVALQTDSARTVKRVYGYTRTSQSEPLLLDSISLTVRPYNATTYYEINSQHLYRRPHK